MAMNSKPPKSEKVRLPSALIPAELFARMDALTPHRGEMTDLIVEALTKEVNRRERLAADAEKKNPA
jgi:NAD(P)H-hydrate repair Nnr-like enzyme with NAD(P)H-hydrate dehydratase domain